MRVNQVQNQENLPVQGEQQLLNPHRKESKKTEGEIPLVF